MRLSYCLVHSPTRMNEYFTDRMAHQLKLLQHSTKQDLMTIESLVGSNTLDITETRCSVTSSAV